VCLRFELQPVRIPQPGGELAMSAGGAIDLPNGRAADLGLNAIFRDVAVGSHTRIELRAVGACRKAFRPMVVDRATRQLA